MTVRASNGPDTGSRRLILDLLKREGPQPAEGLARRLGTTATAARQHLYALNDEGMVTHDRAAPAGVGRPAKLWRLTGAAEALFPDGHAALALDLVAAMRATFGAEGMDRLLGERARAQADAYRKAMAGARSLRGQLAALARARSAEGYMAEVVRQPDGSYLLIENHCPICAAARACSGLCASELAVFRAALGSEVEIERTDHILAGARRCAYRISDRPGLRTESPCGRVGPHEGRELKLMLQGRKPAAMFSDVVPERAFAPHVRAGRIVRFEAEYRRSGESGPPLRLVYFAVAEERWRIERLHALNCSIRERRAGFEPSTEWEIGRLLGYSDEDVDAFLERLRARSSPQRPRS